PSGREGSMHLDLQSIDPSPLAALRVRMTSHERNEFVGTTPTTQTLVISSEARNLLLTKSWRTADSSSPRAPRNDKKTVQGRIPWLKSKLPEKERVQARPAPF